MGFRDYYRQFEEMAPEEISAELRARRATSAAARAEQIEPLDLSGTEWHEPPHPDAVNAATFALRRAVNAYPDAAAAPLREALAARHGVPAEQVVVGHGAGELLRALLAGCRGRAARCSSPGPAGSRCRSSSPRPGPRRPRCRPRRPRSSRARASGRAPSSSRARPTRPARCCRAPALRDLCAGVPEAA